MNAYEAAQLIVWIETLAPAQRFTPDSPEVWAFALDDIRLDDARAALRSVIRSADFVTPRAIVEAVAALRAQRLAAVEISLGDVEELVCGEDFALAREEIRALRTLVGDGAMDRAGYEAYIAAGRPVSTARAIGAGRG